MSIAPVFWFTGLSGAGKTTIAESAGRRLEQDGLRVEIVDGDAVRRSRHSDLGFTQDDIRENNARIVHLCSELRQGCDVILVPIISPYSESRVHARESLEPGFFEIHVDADLATVEARDVKGLYAKARAGEITNLIGYSPGSPFEAPESPDLTLETKRNPPSASSDLLYRFIRQQLRNAATEADEGAR